MVQERVLSYPEHVSGSMGFIMVPEIVFWFFCKRLIVSLIINKDLIGAWYFSGGIILETIVLGAIPIANPAVVSREGLDGGIVLVNCDTGAAVALNTTGKIVWNQINGRHDPAAITAGVRGCFDNVPDTVSDDVAAILETLAKDGFIGYEVRDRPGQ